MTFCNYYYQYNNNQVIIIVVKVDIRMFLEWENSSGKRQIISGKFQNNTINDVKFHLAAWSVELRG